jgi:DNA-binding response OmpR family regulator
MSAPPTSQDVSPAKTAPETDRKSEAPLRALLVSDEEEADAKLAERLAAAGLEVLRSAAREAIAATKRLRPEIVFIAFGERGGEGALVTLARRLRVAPETFATPVVILFREDGRALRSAALRAGADDYFAQDAPASEVRARLASLFWRVEAARRAAPVSREQRDEIDDFIFLLDGVNDDLREELSGAIALVEAEGGAEPGHTLASAHAFLKLNLRRADAVAFYGPTTLVAYLPRAAAVEAQATLLRLREEFRAARSGADLRAGVASFPADGREVEALVEKAEVALRATRGAGAGVLVYGEEPSTTPAKAADETRTAVSHATQANTYGPHVAVNAQEAPAASPSANDKAAPPDFGPRLTSLRRLMLVISDAARMAQVNLLMRSAGYEARAAFDGQHALNLLRIDSPDALLVDYALRDMDGAEMLRRLGQQTGGGRTPPAVLLVPTESQEKARAAIGAKDCKIVPLPYDPVELIEALRESLRPDE